MSRHDKRYRSEAMSPQVNIPVTISIILEKMLLVVKDNFPCPDIPAAISQGPY